MESVQGYITASDSKLVELTLNGNEKGFESLVERYQRQLTSYIYRIVRNYDTALDLTQEVFLKFYLSIHRYNPDYKFSTWIYRIAFNTAGDYLRRPSSKANAKSEDIETYEWKRQVSSRRFDPEADCEKKEALYELMQVLQSLPICYREIIVLRHCHDFDYKEIAHITGLPLGTVKNRLFRARETLRKTLVERGIMQ